MGRRTIEGGPEIEARRGRVEAEIEKERPSVVMIFTAPEMGKPMVSHDSIETIPGMGLKGDRYSTRTGAYSEARIGKKGRIPDEDRQVTFISLEGIEEANRILQSQGIAKITPAQTRRNLVVSMSPAQLNAQVGKIFNVGNCEFIGVEECAPCRRPPTLLGRPKDGKAFEEAFTHRGGLRARILESAIISRGDHIKVR